METLTKTIWISDRAISPVGLRKVRPFSEAIQVGARNATKYFSGKLGNSAKKGYAIPGISEGEGGAKVENGKY